VENTVILRRLVPVPPR